ncbi:MAG: Cyclic di-GMP phosphodiesterase response regulator RpfG [Deltaproteobacteria bacterium ADurb.Bin510]|nr:MAG: Cyclic di-GMP phosphodiesterase response regulator RpfG [Deltaproteobacteria bacterium ADurb.Bin510]
MKQHTILGRNAIASAEKIIASQDSGDFLALAKAIAYSHQEWWDGSGYPEGLSGDDIPLSARLMAVVDVYDALISRRIYKAALPHNEAVEIIRQKRGSHFDPDIVDAFLAVSEEFLQISQTFADSLTE